MRPSYSTLPELGEPREWSLVGRYLPDASLHYTRISMAGPGPARVMLLVVACVVALALATVPLILALSRNGILWLAPVALVGIGLCLELWGPLRATWVESRSRVQFWWRFRDIELGLDRAVVQAGTLLRYEVHLPARRTVQLDGVQVRLVFWEAWRQKRRLRFLRVPVWRDEKQGHDVVRHELSGFSIARGQHAVVRGAIRIPAVRPSEYHRHKRRHVSYVNLTVTLIVRGQSTNSPCLITFPWM